MRVYMIQNALKLFLFLSGFQRCPIVKAVMMSRYNHFQVNPYFCYILYIYSKYLLQYIIIYSEPIYQQHLHIYSYYRKRYLAPL